MNLCVICNTEIENCQSKFCSQTCKTKYFNSKNNNYSIQKDRGINRKLYFINKKGGCCEICGYKQNMAGLVFHHIDPSKKKFNVDGRSLGNRSLKELTLEVEKCQLLCHLCHTHHHNPHLDMSNFDEHIINIELKSHICKELINKTEEEINKIIESINNTNLNKTALWLEVSSTALSNFLDRENLRDRIKFFRQTKIQWPSNEELLKMLSESNYSAVGRKLGVSDNAIRKHLKSK